ncbi:hypothetical protein TVAG_128220 [Trichomonas vaginalis G3]|uniref:Uncharacterized protein n=1 Tax=Trichomonas vaginalis (strain ATCC PRA-98 / G3) TaxID=412133 RepID=A2EBI3_TRIV3|nr:sperm-tail PG-rich repeat-containing protein [Trichomonas vaginalis G3]EAY10013.1 hypothetical protein TVAG_128220 [Trichomonas vaginalis G3]KAI5535085.1 sperm-tail PG-rich repeat-containing protein [Trichomonas vaginalis G3]|eukprot:XP_001322236.1 hypothetical protein [Trichomonas vaginalis G3]
MEAEFNIYFLGNTGSTPGPSDYSPTYKFTDKKGISISPRYMKNPKPYDPPLAALPTTIGKGPKVSIGSKYKEPKNLQTPGPNYVPPDFGQVNGVKFPRAKKPKDKSIDSPSPQTYHFNYGTDIGVGRVPATIGNAPRKNLFNGDPDTPSAGNYSPRFEFQSKHARSPRPTIGYRWPEKKVQSSSEYHAAPSTLSPRGYVFGRAGRTLIVHK